MPKISMQEATVLVSSALARAGASQGMADSTARSLVLAEAQGLGSHGLSRVGQYVTHLKNGRVNGAAVASLSRRKGGALLIDAQEGLAFPACALAVAEAIAAAGEFGVSFAGVVRSHHCGVVVDHLRPAWWALVLPTRHQPCPRPVAGMQFLAPIRLLQSFLVEVLIRFWWTLA